MGDPLTEVQRKTPVVHVIFDDGLLDFVNIEQEAAGLIPFGTDFVYPDLAKVAEAGRAKGIRLEDPQDVREGLRAASRTGRAGGGRGAPYPHTSGPRRERASP